MEQLAASSLRNIAYFAPKCTRISCLSRAARDKLICGCSKRTHEASHLALSTMGRDALVAAISCGDVEVVQHLVVCLPCSKMRLQELCPSLSDRGTTLATPLGHAALEGKLDIMKALIHVRAEIGGDDQIKQTARHGGWTQMTVLLGAIQTDVQLQGSEHTKLLLNAGSSVNQFQWLNSFDCFSISLTPLIAALPSPELLRLLITATADVNGIQYAEDDQVDQCPGQSFTPLEYVRKEKWSSAEHEPLADSMHAHSILREHHADAVWCNGIPFAMGDIVVVTSEADELLRASRAAGIGTDYDQRRCAALGRRAEVCTVDGSDLTARLRFWDAARPDRQAPPSPTAPQTWAQADDFCDGVWFPLGALSRVT